MSELAAILHRVSALPAGSVLATLVRVAGSSYRRAGARLLIEPSGARLGSISGGCLEADVCTRAAAVAASGRAEWVTYDTTTENDLVWGVGLGCHGVVDLLLEKLPANPRWAVELTRNLAARRPTQLTVVWRADDPAMLGTRLAQEMPSTAPGWETFSQIVEPPPALWVFGAGDDARPLVHYAKSLGWQVTVADPRPEFATPRRFPEADACVVAPAPDLASHAPAGSDAVAVVMTHRYVHDVPILRALLARDLRYIGLLGPKKRAARILADLATDGFRPSDSALQALHAPVGLDLGAETPEEVALSIVAEIQATLGQRNAQPLREREKPIHG